MLSFAIIVFREVFEAALILGILLASTRGLQKRIPWIWIGILLGLSGSCVVAYFAQMISQALEGMGQEVFNASVLLIAAVLIGWMVVWMHGYGKTLTKELKEVGQNILKGSLPLYTLATVIALSVLRDGSEVVLFSYGILVSGQTLFSLVMGGLLGLGLGSAVGIILYYGLLKIPTGKLFSITNWLLILLAAGMVSQAVGFLSAAGFVPEIIYPVWDTSRIISDSSLMGQILHTLLGYNARPSAMQLICYFITFSGISLILKFYEQIFMGNNSSKKVVTAIFIFLTGLFLGTPQEAWATKKVYSPIVEKGELELEWRGGIDFDERKDKDNKQKQKYAVGYGVTDRWFTEIYGEIEKNAGQEEFDFTTIEWENILQLFEQGQYWVDAGLYLAYETTVRDQDPEKLEAKILLEKSLPHFTHTANFIFEKEMGDGNEADLEGGFAWSSRYRWKEYLEPGIEFHAYFGELKESNSYQNQKHQLGPVIYGKLFNHVKYDIGYLYGITDAAPEGALKWIFEFEQHF